MSFKNAVVKLAAAAVVVAGGAGTVWAQGTKVLSLPYTPVSIPAASITGGNGKMTVMYKQETKPIKVNFLGLPSAGIKEVDAAILKYDTETEFTESGNLGTFEVETTHENWDITLNTANLGRLRFGGSATGKALMVGTKGTTAQDTVRLGIQIGVIGSDNDGYLHSVVPPDWLKNSKTAAIGFSQVLANPKDNTQYATVKDELGNRSLVNIAEQGFGPPDATNVNGKIKFFVNIGCSIDPTTKIIRGNSAGYYTDTLKFVLVAGD
ncbi:MAG: hypothetical protein LBB74_01030 [Chitinispirillales bacterium]|jgi:hypothetical protein|nr:hypothetical protein [Chitinispirillales bacterium]